MTSEHQKYRPSHSPTWMNCAGALALSRGLPDAQGQWAEMGSRQHRLAEIYIHGKLNPAIYKDQALVAEMHGLVENGLSEAAHQSVKDYANTVTGRAEPGDALLLEQEVRFGRSIGAEPNQKGTLDMALVRSDGKSILIVDRKFPWGKRVNAAGDAPPEEDEDAEAPTRMQGHPPLMLYALGVLETFGGILFHVKELERIDFAIYQEQPGRPGALDEWSCTPQYLESFRAMARNAVRRCQTAERSYGSLAQAQRNGVGDAADLQDGFACWFKEYLSPGMAQCKYCRAKAVCPALMGLVESVVPLVEEL